MGPIRALVKPTRSQSEPHRRPIAERHGVGMRQSVLEPSAIPLAPRSRPRAAGLPRIAGWLTAVVGSINLISALTPELPGRLAALGRLAPHGLVLAAHALVLPAGLAL